MSKNFNRLGLEELSLAETISIEGGVPGPHQPTIFSAYYAARAWAAQEWSDFCDGFGKEYNQAHPK